MRGFIAIFWLEMTSLVRSKALAMLVFASVAWMFALPHLATGDGTAEGARELWVRYSLGGVFALLVVALLASATGSLARERESKRLALTVVRPVRYWAAVLAKAAALLLTGAAVLALACAALPVSSGTAMGRPCRHVLSPVLPSPREEAKAMYAAYMEDPSTPEAVRKADPAVVLRLLESRAADHYLSVQTNAGARWEFVLPEGAAEDLRVRVRFAGRYDSRQDACGVFRLGNLEGVVSNMTQAVLEVPLSSLRDRSVASPLAPRDRSVASPLAASLSFENWGRETLMLRPRKDIVLLVPADAFGWNIVRAYLEMVGVLAMVIAFGLFLSASLGRSVALFVAMVTLIVGEMSPGVVERHAEGLDARAADRIGLALTRAVAEVTRPVSALDPVSRLATDACVEAREVVRVVLVDLLLVPLLLSLLAGWVLPRKSA